MFLADIALVEVDTSKNYIKKRLTCFTFTNEVKFDADHIVLDDYKLATYICLRKQFYHLWIQQKLGAHFSLQQSNIGSCQEIEN